ncbi:MAG: hypothetical protein KF880_06810 [Ferruginibacter sp.]|nr:hypothetical protein [Ferruginibacter sp.]
MYSGCINYPECNFNQWINLCLARWIYRPHS